MNQPSPKKLARMYDQAAELVIALAIEQAHKHQPEADVRALLVTAGALQDVSTTLRIADGGKR